MILRPPRSTRTDTLFPDTTLCRSLGNEPGIFSARWAGPDRDFGLAMQLVWDNLTAKGPEAGHDAHFVRSEEHTSELQSLMRISYAVFCLQKKLHQTPSHTHYPATRHYPHNTTSTRKTLHSIL